MLCALLMRRYRQRAMRYWKPIQTGDDDDCETVRRLTELPPNRFVPVLNRYAAPLSPHRAAELESAEVDTRRLIKRFNMEREQSPLIVEGAGGLLVPITRRYTWLDFLNESGLPVVIAARSGLGTINHSLLTVRALQSAQVPVLGLAFCGVYNEDNVHTISDLSGLPVIACFDPNETDFKNRLRDDEHAIDAHNLLESYL